MTCYFDPMEFPYVVETLLHCREVLFDQNEDFAFYSLRFYFTQVLLKISTVYQKNGDYMVSSVDHHIDVESFDAPDLPQKNVVYVFDFDLLPFIYVALALPRLLKASKDVYMGKHEDIEEIAWFGDELSYATDMARLQSMLCETFHGLNTAPKSNLSFLNLFDAY